MSLSSKCGSATLIDPPRRAGRAGPALGAVSTTTQVSLAPAARRAPSAAVPCHALLDAQGARVILGASDAPFGLAVPVAPSADSMFGPRGVCAAPDGTLWVADTGHHRVLGWLTTPQRDNTPADIVLGQPGFDREGRNARGSTSADSLNVPTGIAVCGKDDAGLVLADAWNHRVLIWRRRPRRSHQRPDVVLGQADFDGGESNRGSESASASTLFWPYCVAWDGANLWVADTGNRRVLMWRGLPECNGQPADLVLGQNSFATRDENGGGAPDSSSMRWPHAIAFANGGVFVADAGNNRIMLWRRTPSANNTPCDVLVGQAKPNLVEHNQANYFPDAACLNMPYGATLAGELLVVADTANSRLLAWRVDALVEPGVNAHALAAQPDWNSKGDNRWLPAARDSVCWPYSVSMMGQATLLVADSGNNRVMLWPLAGQRP
jgi:NHL repeat